MIIYLKFIFILFFKYLVLPFKFKILNLFIVMDLNLINDFNSKNFNQNKIFKLINDIIKIKLSIIRN